MKKKLLILLAILSTGSMLLAQTSVLPGDGTLSAAIAAAADGEILELVPGGLYTESTAYNLGTLVEKGITIQVEGESPEYAKIQILKAPDAENSTIFFELGDGSSITLRNLEFDGLLNDIPTAYSVINFDMGEFPASTIVGTIRIENCYIHDLTDHVIKAGNSDMAGYVLVDSTFLDNVVIYNTETSVYYKYAGSNFISITNSTFHVLDGYGLRIAGPGYTLMDDHTPTAIIDRTTWYDIGFTDMREIILLERGPNLNPWTVTNSIFVKHNAKEKITINIKDTTGDSLATITNICLWDHGDLVWRDHLVEDTIFVDPQFTDPDNGDFTLPEGSPLLTFASDGGAIGDPRWATNAPTAIENHCGQILQGFNLSQNYPNPFNPTTQIVFNLEKPGLTVLSVYDVLGKRVAELVNTHLNAGEHRVEFNSTDLPSGVYLYQLNSAGQTISKKMMFIK